jgi:hypothetical protein
LYRLFVHADNRSPLIIRTVIHLKYILHIRHKRRVFRGRYAPALLLTRFQGCFFNTPPMVVRDNSIPAMSLLRSSSSRKVLRLYPGGGSPQLVFSPDPSPHNKSGMRARVICRAGWTPLVTMSLSLRCSSSVNCTR